MNWFPSGRLAVFALLAACLTAATSSAQPESWAIKDLALAKYFREETAKLTDACLAEVQTLDDWESHKDEYRRQLREMLGLDPLPPRTPLEPVITGTIEHGEFVVENLHFQSLPGLYVTGNLYRPKTVDEKLPAILYVCGHARVVKDGVSFGNKTSYQHHGEWFARHGYVCLTIDTIQLGEIEGIHHGTYRYGMWWWNSRGYTPAGVEAWNCMRALDYLETRPEVDAARFGITGRSGGGAYSWWAAAVDERIKVAVPVAGITSLKNHVVDGCVEGHCDCMFMVNTYRWDFPQVAALVAPRPLLISNSDKDRIFPLDGVVDVYNKTRRIYELYDAGDKLGLHITEGPHKDTQELQLHAFTWFDRWLKGEQVPIEDAAKKFFQPEQLRVFEELPEDERVTTIHDSFVPTAADKSESPSADRVALMRLLHGKTFAGWPDEDEIEPLEVELVRSSSLNGAQVREYEFTSQYPFRQQLVLIEPERRPAGTTSRLKLAVLDEGGWGSGDLPEPLADASTMKDLVQELNRSGEAVAFVAVRGVGPTAWDADEKKQIQIRRRFMLLGQTLDGMRVFDVRRALAALRSIDDCFGLPIEVKAENNAAVWSLYAALFDGKVDRLQLARLPVSHAAGPDMLNVLRFTDIPEVVRAVSTSTPVRLIDSSPERLQKWQQLQSTLTDVGSPPLGLEVIELDASGEENASMD